MQENNDLWLYSQLYDSLILLSLDYNTLFNMAARLFNPLSELETCFDYAFNTLFEQIIEIPKIKNTDNLIPKLLQLKETLNDSPNNLWEYDALKNDSFWNTIRKEADSILNLLGETQDRIFEKKHHA